MSEPDSEFGTLELEGSQMESISPTDFKRLERKVDTLVDKLSKLIIFEERQTQQGARVGDLETELALLKQEVSVLDKKLDRWINRGIGIWAAVGIVYSLALFITTRSFIWK